MADQIHPNEFGYFEMAKQAVNVLNKALKASFYATTDEAQAGARYTARGRSGRSRRSPETK